MLIAPKPSFVSHIKPYIVGLGLVVGLIGSLQAAEQPTSRVDLGPWQAYLAYEITPRLERIEAPVQPENVEPSWWVVDQSWVVPEFAQAWISQKDSPNTSALRLAWVEPRWGTDHRPATLLSLSRSRVEQSLMMPGVTTQVSDRGAVTVSAVLAAQRFVNPGMNLVGYEGMIPVAAEGQWLSGQRSESSHGFGLRVAHRFEPVEAWVIETAFQSRIDMNPLATLQGVHGAEAQLDIPSRFEATMGWQITPAWVASVGMSHIFYSEVGAFPSRAMPARFSSLLGDSTSPEFAWRDLTVTTVGLGWQVTERLSAEVEYKNRAHPKPTVQALADALGSELNTHAWRVGLTQSMGEGSRVHVSAAYAPPEYVFGGHVLGVVSDELKQGLEFQALWQLFF